MTTHSAGADEPAREQVIHLTDLPPIRIIVSEWPIVGRVMKEEGNGDEWRRYVNVRANADGRRIIYGSKREAGKTTLVGFLLDEDDGLEELGAAIRRASDAVGIDHAAVFMSMKAEEV